MRFCPQGHKRERNQGDIRDVPDPAQPHRHPVRRGLCRRLALLPAAAQNVEAFYKSHELTILIGHPPGGSYDLYAQLAAAHIGKYIPGKPTVIVQSMPGGAGSKAASYLYAKGPQGWLDDLAVSRRPSRMCS